MTEIAFNKSVDGAVLRDVVFLVYLSYDSRSERVDVSIATRMNGAAPPEVALTDIDLGSEHFWSLDDAARDGAFATLRREAPISFQSEPVVPGYEVGKGHWVLTKFDDVHHASRHPEIFSSRPTSTAINDVPMRLPSISGR